METKPRIKGSWGLRLFIILLSVVLGVLLFWLLSFIENDIGTVRGPDYEAVRKMYVPESFDLQKKELSKEIESVDRKIQTLREQQQLLSSSTGNLQSTINQLLDIQRESLNKNVQFPEYIRNTLEESQSIFLKNQERYQQYNKEISELTVLGQGKQEELNDINQKIVRLEEDAGNEFDKLSEKHRLTLAAVKLAFLVPVFIVISLLFMKFRTGSYWPLVWVAFIAAFLKITLVAHEYFPSRYFKYIAIIVIIAIVLRILIYLLRMIAAPKRDLLIKQYQQEYDKCNCPMCGKPILTGMLRLAGCLKKKNILTVPDGRSAEQEPYTCPSCGTTLYEKCGSCGGVRHTLLPYCEHCGSEKESKV